jgi:hypothetical protein
MLNWIVSIALVSLLTTVLIILLPDNNNSQIAKFSLSLLVILIVINPIKNDINLNFNFDNNNYSEVFIQEEFLEYYLEQKIEYIKKNCNIICNEEGVKNVIVDVVYEILESNEISIKKICLNFTNSVFTESEEHTNIIENIKNKLNKIYITEIDALIN